MGNTSGIAAFSGALLYKYLILMTLIWGIMSITYPFGWDQGIFAWVGQGINQGEMPYKDRWDIKGPLTFYIYALAQFLFGHNLWGIRVIDLIFLLSAAGVLNVFVGEFTNKSVARWTAALFILWYASGAFWHTAQPDGWVSMLMVLALMPLVSKQSNIHWSRFLIIGILIGCAVLIKPIYICFTLIALAAILFQDWTHRTRIFFHCIVVSIGKMIPIALCLSWFAYQGALQSLFEVWIDYPFKVYSGVTDASPLTRVKGLVEYFLSKEVVSVVLPITGLGVYSFWRSNKRGTIILLLWIIVAVFCVVIQNRFFTYHWIVIYPPIAFFCAVGFHALFFQLAANTLDERIQLNSAVRIVASISLLVVVFHATVRPAFEVMNWLAFITNRVTKEQYYAGLGVPGPEMQAADYIKAVTKKDERVVIWGWNISILYYSERQTISRFGYSMPLIMGEGTKERESYRQEFLNSLYATPPVYIVVAPQSDMILRKHYDLSDFKEFAEFVATKYVEEKRFGDLVLYRRTGG